MNIMKILALTLVVLIIATSPVFADDDYITFAKSLTARQYDKTLPSVPIRQWLASNLPRDVHAVWGQKVTDCGEWTGSPELDRVRDMPLCAEIELRKEEKVVGILLLFVGTEKKGKMNRGGLYYGYFKRGEKAIDLNDLRDIKKMKGHVSNKSRGEREPL
jgi:hypothetical protein